MKVGPRGEMFPGSVVLALAWNRKPFSREQRTRTQTILSCRTTGRPATMNVNDGANNSPQTVSLTGTGK